MEKLIFLLCIALGWIVIGVIGIILDTLYQYYRQNEVEVKAWHLIFVLFGPIYVMVVFVLWAFDVLADITDAPFWQKTLFKAEK